MVVKSTSGVGDVIVNPWNNLIKFVGDGFGRGRVVKEGGICTDLGVKETNACKLKCELDLASSIIIIDDFFCGKLNILKLSRDLEGRHL